MVIRPKLTLEKVCEIINAKYTGDPAFEITGLNEIHKVGKGDLTFVDHPKYYDKALGSEATTIIINSDRECPDGKALIFSDNPFRDFNILSRKFSPFQPAEKSICDTAKIGEGTVIQPGAFVGNHVVIGKNCIIHSNVSIYDGVNIGDNVIIHANTVIGSDAFYFKKLPEGYEKLYSTGRVLISDHVEIGANCTIDKGVSGITSIGENSKLDNQVHLGHDSVIGKNCLIAAQVGIAGVVTIEDDVILWGQVGIQKDLTIGKGTVVLGQSGVPKTLEGDKTYFGSPVQEARAKMKELALIKSLPIILGDLNRIDPPTSK